jgi:glycosyltransferase involved in cell wall biosynthesis
MQRKKILWLVSWFPNKKDRFDGDFIQRHARAAAIYHDVHVIFVTDDDIDQSIEEEWNYATGLAEQVIYFKRKEGIAARYRKQVIWKKSFQNAVKKYIEKNGLPDCVHVHVPWKAGLIALWLKKKYGKEFIVTEHWGIYNKTVEDNFYTRSRFFQTLLKRIFSEAKCFVSVSKFLAKGIEGIVGRRANYIIPNVVDTTLFFYKEEKYSKFTFIHVSNMVPLKKVDAILDAFKLFLEETGANAQMILIGNRDNNYPCYAEGLRLLNHSVFFMGEIQYTEVAKEMQRSHCFILNSTMENSPCVIGEAFCCGLPVIATAVGGVPELIDHSNGMLIPSGDVHSLVNAMKEVWTNYFQFNPQQIAEDASKKFSYSTIAANLYELYDTC